MFSFRLEKHNNTQTEYKQSNFIKNKLVLVDFKVMPISRMGPIWSIEICQEIELIFIT